MSLEARHAGQCARRSDRAGTIHTAAHENGDWTRRDGETESALRIEIVRGGVHELRFRKFADVFIDGRELGAQAICPGNGFRRQSCLYKSGAADRGFGDFLLDLERAAGRVGCVDLLPSGNLFVEGDDLGRRDLGCGIRQGTKNGVERAALGEEGIAAAENFRIAIHRAIGSIDA